MRSPGTLCLLLCFAAPAAADSPLAPILRDLRVDGTLRLFRFDRDHDRATRDLRDFALGGRLAFRTGRVAGIRGGAAIHTSRNLEPRSGRRAVYGLLAADRSGNHRDYTAAAEAYLDGLWGGLSIRAGRTELTTPWVNGHDVRMTPHTFEVVHGVRRTGRWRFEAGVVTAIKPRTREDFITPAEVLGFGPGGRIVFGGATYTHSPRLKFQLWRYATRDVWDDWHAELDAAVEAGRGVTLFTNLRHLRRDEAGSALLGEQSTFMSGGTLGAKWHGWTISGALSRIGDRQVRRPWGHALAISEIYEPCDEAGEKSWLARLQYDFARLGVKGLTAGVSYSEFTVPLPGAGGRIEKNEMNYDLRRVFSDAWEARVRLARFHSARNGLPTEGLRDLRLQLTYRFSAGLGKSGAR